ncbi:hypothetical protein BDR06DRAFT_1015709 [Suillus hirtellus]|nr:hypothetical protein BDR06DRAFT_1015709 [Suillus hirtellus]
MTLSAQSLKFLADRHPSIKESGTSSEDDTKKSNKSAVPSVPKIPLLQVELERAGNSTFSLLNLSG